MDGGSRSGFDEVARSDGWGEKNTSGEQRIRDMRASARARSTSGRLLFADVPESRAATGGGAFIEAYYPPDYAQAARSGRRCVLQDANFEIVSVRGCASSMWHRRAWPRTLENQLRRIGGAACQGEQVARVWRLYLDGGGLAFEEGRMGVASDSGG